VATFLPLFRHEDGREQPGQAFTTDEHLGRGHTVEHDGRRWRLEESEMLDGDSSRFKIIFVPDVPVQ
jgi:hypothetical protein